MRMNIIMITILTVHSLFSTISPVDSLESRLRHIQNRRDSEAEAEKVDLLLKLGKKYEYRDPQKSLEIGRDALQIALELQDRKKEAQALDNIGYGLFFLSDYDSAAVYFRQSQQIDRETGDREGLVYSLNGMNMVYRERGELDKAFSYCQQALEIALETEDDLVKATVYNSMGNLYRETSEYDRAMDYYQLCLEIVKNTDDMSRQAGTLMNMAVLKKIIGENKDALAYANQGLELMRTAGDSLGVASLYTTIGTIYQNIGYNEKAITYFQMAEAIQRSSNVKAQLAGTIFNIGNSYLDLGLKDRAFENYFTALDITEKTQNNSMRARLYSKLGNLYEDLAQPEQAFTYYDKALNLYREIDDKSGMSHVITEIAIFNSALGHYEIALENYWKAYEIRKEIGDETGAAWSMLNTGVTYYYLHDYAKTLKYNQIARDTFRERNDQRGLATALHNIGDSYFQLKDNDSARENLEESLEISREIKYRGLTLANYELLTELHTIQGDFATALRYFRHYSALKDSLFTDNSRKTLLNLQLKYDTERKEKENQELQFRITRQELERTRLYILFAAALILALFLFYLYYSKQRYNRILKIRIQEALKKQKEQQQIIVHQASLTSLGELAAGIAHEINQPLQSIYLSTESIELENKGEQPDRQYMNSMIRDVYQDVDRIRKIIEHIRIFSSGQRDEIKEEFNINNSIQAAFSLLKQQFSQHRIKVDFDLDDNISTILGNPYKFEQVMVNLLNNARDSLEEKADIAREEFSPEIKVRTYEKEGLIMTEVEDNGMGIPEDIKTSIFLPFFTTKELKRGTGLGLSISHGIIKDMQGIIEVDSEHLQGARFTIRIPVVNID